MSSSEGALGAKLVFSRCQEQPVPNAMISTFAVSNYRSLKNVVSPLSSLNVVTGPNGCGKSNLYKALRLLAETTKGNLISSIAQEGGLDYTFWAGPEKLTRGMRDGSNPIEGTAKRNSSRLRLGFVGEDFATPFHWGCPHLRALRATKTRPCSSSTPK